MTALSSQAASAVHQWGLEESTESRLLQMIDPEILLDVDRYLASLFPYDALLRQYWLNRHQAAIGGDAIATMISRGNEGASLVRAYLAHLITSPYS